MNGGLHVAHLLAPDAAAPSRARRIVSGQMETFVGARRLKDLELLVSELVTGRIHPEGGESPPDERRRAPGQDLVLDLDLEAHEVLRCTVVDHGPAALPSQWSMRILDLLADRWGVSRDRGATSMWFECAIPA